MGAHHSLPCRCPTPTAGAGERDDPAHTGTRLFRDSAHRLQIPDRRASGDEKVRTLSGWRAVSNSLQCSRSPFGRTGKHVSAPASAQGADLVRRCGSSSRGSGWLTTLLWGVDRVGVALSVCLSVDDGEVVRRRCHEPTAADRAVTVDAAAGQDQGPRPRWHSRVIFGAGAASCMSRAVPSPRELRAAKAPAYAHLAGTNQQRSCARGPALGSEPGHSHRRRELTAEPPRRLVVGDDRSPNGGDLFQDQPGSTRPSD